MAGPRTFQDKVAASKQKSDAPSTVPSSNPEILTMVLVSAQGDEMEENYAVMPLPETYEVSRMHTT